MVVHMGRPRLTRQRRMGILESAVEVIGERGLCETRIADVARRAGDPGDPGRPGGHAGAGPADMPGNGRAGARVRAGAVEAGEDGAGEGSGEGGEDMTLHPRQNWRGRRGWPWGDRLIDRREFLRLSGGAALAAAMLACARRPEPAGSGASAIRIGSPQNPVTQPMFDDNAPIESGLEPEAG